MSPAAKRGFRSGLVAAQIHFQEEVELSLQGAATLDEA
jgi:hypothetical protein